MHEILKATNSVTDPVERAKITFWHRVNAVGKRIRIQNNALAMEARSKHLISKGAANSAMRVLSREAQRKAAEEAGSKFKQRGEFLPISLEGLKDYGDDFEKIQREMEAPTRKEKRAIKAAEAKLAEDANGEEFGFGKMEVGESIAGEPHVGDAKLGKKPGFLMQLVIRHKAHLKTWNGNVADEKAKGETNEDEMEGVETEEGVEMGVAMDGDKAGGTDEGEVGL